MANAIPITKQDSKPVEDKDGPEVIGKLPEGFKIPAGAKKIVVDERGTVRVDL